MEPKLRRIDHIRLNKEKSFDITMENYHVDMKTGRVATSVLKSIYTRKIYELLHEEVGLARYTMKETEYKGMGQNEFKKWTFAAGAVFYNTLYELRGISYEEALKQYESSNKKLYPDFDECFSRYPKLPSVYLLIMQALDIISLDSYLSLINTRLYTDEIHTEYKKIEELSGKRTGIGASLYADTSYYYNDDFYVRLIGYGCFAGKRCYVFDYDSKPSEVYMKELTSEHAKKNKSIYHGRVYIDKKDGELLGGEMNENVIPIGGAVNYVNRKVILNARGRK